MDANPTSAGAVDGRPPAVPDLPPAATFAGPARHGAGRAGADPVGIEVAAARRRARRARRARTAEGTRTSTADRILDAALVDFGTRGYEATSLDVLAAELGIRKQTILYYHPSKAALLDAVVDRAATQLADVLVAAVAGAGVGFERVEALVRSVFALAVRQPEMLGLLREVSRPGSTAAARVVARLEPLVDRAAGFMEVEMEAGRFRRGDPRLLLLSTYSTVVGAATEVEVLRALGIEPTLRSAAVRRRELLTFLRRALVAEPGPTAG